MVSSNLGEAGLLGIIGGSIEVKIGFWLFSSILARSSS
jgi:hypothetical protein